MLEGNKVLYFYTAWCGPCKKIEPVLDAFEERIKGRAGFARIDCEKERAKANEASVCGTPAFIFVKDGQIVRRLFGAVDIETLVEVTDKTFSHSKGISDSDKEEA